MAELTLSRPIKTPAGQQQTFMLPEQATLRLFRGMKMPISIDADKRTTIHLETDAVVRFLANVLELPPSFAEAIPLDLVAEAVPQLLPLLPPAWQAYLMNGNATLAN